MKKNQLASIAVSLGTIALLVGCGAASDEVSEGEQQIEPASAPEGDSLDELREARAEQERLDEEAGLTFTLPVEDGHIVRFTLPEGGNVLLVGERMLQGQTPVMAGLGASTVAEMVDMLSPGTQLPQRFQDFVDTPPLELTQGEDGAPGEDGAVDVALEAPVPDIVLPADTLIEKHVTSSGAHHRDVHHNCPIQMGSPPINGSATACDLNVSLIDRTVNATHSGAVVGSYLGSTVVSFFYNGNFAASATLLQGELGWFWVKSETTRNCSWIFGCGSFFTPQKPHRWVTDSRQTGGMHHSGVVWVRTGMTGPLFPIFG